MKKQLNEIVRDLDFFRETFFNDVYIREDKVNACIIHLLESVKEWAEGEKKDNVFVPDHTPSMHGGLVCRACGGQEDCECETYNSAISDLIKHLQTQIKEINK